MYFAHLYPPPLTRPPLLAVSISDVGYETYKAHRRGPTALEAAHFSEPTRLSLIAVKRSVFQSIASMYVYVPARIVAARVFIELTQPLGHCQLSRSTPPLNRPRRRSPTCKILVSERGAQPRPDSPSSLYYHSCSMSLWSMSRMSRLSG